MHVIKRNTCRVCRSKSLKAAISLGEQFLQGSFVKEGVNTPLRKLPMNLVRCNPQEDENACGLLQAEYTVPPEMMYFNYWYKSGTNKTMRDHLKGIVNAALSFEPDDGGPMFKRHIGEQIRVLDIGCNDGTLLNFYPENFERWGIDPSNIAASVSPPLKIVNDFFPSDAFTAAVLAFKPRSMVDVLSGKSMVDILSGKSPPQQFHIITAVAMFYDLEDPVTFVQAVDSWLAPDGIFVFEMSHMPAMLRQNSYDTLCHEHVEYYSFATIENILRRGNLRAVFVSENNINGGSIRVFAVKKNSLIRAGKNVEAMRIKEFDLKLDTDEPYLDFQKRADIHRKDLLALLHKIKNDNKRVHVYGASTKGNTLLQWCNIDSKLVDFAADRNPDKDGARTPGTDIPIISEEKSRAMKPDFYLVLPWHFRDEFLEREKETLATGTRFIFPLPKIEVIGG